MFRTAENITTSCEDDVIGGVSPSLKSKKKRNKYNGGGDWAEGVGADDGTSRRRNVCRVVATLKGKKIEGEGPSVRAAKLRIAEQLGVPFG